MIRQLPTMDETTLHNFLSMTDSIYVVFRAVGEEIKEAYTCDAKQEIEELKDRMEGFAGEFHAVAKAN